MGKYPVIHCMESAFMFLQVMLAWRQKGCPHRDEKLGEMVPPLALIDRG